MLMNVKPMDLQLIEASVEHTFLLENLMQFYIYDFSEYIGLDVMRNGLFEEYKDLSFYWQQDGKYAYLVKRNNHFIGFVLLKTMDWKDQQYYSIAEFFILKKYRLQGIGKKVAAQVFDQHKGHWKISQLINNKPAGQFWTSVVNVYSSGNFNSYISGQRCIQEFKNC